MCQSRQMDALSRILSIKHSDSGLFAKVLSVFIGWSKWREQDSGFLLVYYRIDVRFLIAYRWNIGPWAGLNLNASPAVESSVKFLLATPVFTSKVKLACPLSELVNYWNAPALDQRKWNSYMDEERVVYERSLISLRNVWTKAEPDSR